jgi:GT2 family glycosyltransferase
MKPHLSVVIPTLDRPASLAATLEALTQQGIGTEAFEAIVVDDGSRVPPHDVVVRFAARLRLSLLLCEHAGPGAARNAGVAAAAGRFVCFTDHDCCPAPDWLQRLSERFGQDPEAAYGGRTLNALTQRLGDAACQATTDAVLSYFVGQRGQAEFLPTQNLAFPAAAFRELGGFDPRFPFAAEERELCDRWRLAGHRLVYAPEVVVQHHHGLTVAAFLRQQFRYGQGARSFARLRVLASQRPVPVDWRFYRHLLWHPFAHGLGPHALAVGVLAWLGRVAYVSGHLAEGYLWRGARAQDLPPRPGLRPSVSPRES